MAPTKSSTGGLRSFFESLTTMSATSDIEGLAAMYAPTVMIAGPGGAQVVTSADLLRAIPKRKQLFESAGHRSTALVGFEETGLSDRYALVRTEWKWLFETAAGATDVTLPSTFIVDTSGDAPHIVVYVSHQDIVAVLRARGILPPAA
jgi:hypothetical protein